MLGAAVTMPWLRRMRAEWSPRQRATALPRGWSTMRSVVSEKIGRVPAKNQGALATATHRLAERREGHRVDRMGVDHGVDVGPRPQHLRMDEHLVVPRHRAVDLAALDVDRDDIVRPNLLAADAGRGHWKQAGVGG